MAEEPLAPVEPVAAVAPVFATGGFGLVGVDMLILIIECAQTKTG